MAAAAQFPIVTSPAPHRLWTPKRVYLTRAASEWKYAQDVAQRASVLGSEIIQLKSNRLPRLTAENDRRLYAEAKSTLALVVSPPSSFKLNPIPPSADWQFHLAQGCPAHCQYCYLAGSLAGPPITRVDANIEEILVNLPNYLGKGQITSRSQARQTEGTTFEASCYTDPLALEHLTGALARSIQFFGTWQAPVQLRWTTKFANVDSLLKLDHNRRTRVRFSVNANHVARNYEGGTPPVSARLAAMRQLALAGFPVGLTIAPIIEFPNWQEGYSQLLNDAATALDGIPGVDLSIELITHRFTPGSKEVLLNWYPRTPLDLDEAARAEKRTKFGGFKYVYPASRMAELKSYLYSAIAETLPTAKILYWT